MTEHQPENADTCEPDVPRFLMDAVTEVERLTKFARMVGLGFAFGARLTSFVELFRHTLRKSAKVDALVKPFEDHARELEQYANNEAQGGMGYLNSLLTVRIVTIIESVVADALMESLENVPEVLGRDQVRRIKGPLMEFIAASPSERAEYLAAALSQDAKAPLRSGVARFESILDAVDLAGEVDTDARKVLFEMLQVRNVIIHRNGRADSRFRKECSWVAIDDHLITITPSMLNRYRAAALYYLGEIVERWVRRAGGDVSRFSELRLEALKKLR